MLSTTINRYAFGTLRPRTDGHVSVQSLDFGQSVTYSAADRLRYDGKLDLVKAALIHLGVGDAGFDLFLHTDAPPGSGLGASSAMMVALVGVLKENQSLPLTDYGIADLAYRLERQELGIEGGLQDQYAATFGGFNFIEFSDQHVVVNPLRVPADVQNELQYNLLLVFTGRIRLSARIIEDQVRRYRSGKPESVEALRALKHLAIEMKGALLRRRLDDFGRLLHEQWLQKRRMSPKISNPELDAIYQAAIDSGATGGKLTGAGGGGHMLLYCPNETRQRVGQRLTEMGCTVTDFSFEPVGLQTWRIGDAR